MCAVTCKGGKYIGSPRKLQQQTLKKMKKEGKYSVTDASTLENNIIFGWYFNCCCGASGTNYHDKHKSIQCDICKIWMHCWCIDLPTKTSDLLLLFSGRRIWVCPDCKKGKFKYRSIHWQEPKPVTANTENEKEIKIKKNVKFATKCIPPPRIPSVYNFTKLPLDAVLKEPRKYSEGETLPTPTSMERRSMSKVC